MKGVLLICLSILLYITDIFNKVEVANATRINSSNDDFAPYLKDGNLYFVVKEQSKQRKYNTKNIQLDLEESATSIKGFNHGSHTSLAFHNSGNAFFTKESLKGNSSRLVTYDIYYFNSKLELNAVPFNSRDYDVMNPTFTKDGRYMIFQSNLDHVNTGNEGGYDLFISEITFDRTKNPARLYLSPPVNLGVEVNSEDDETHPFFHDNTLYFSKKKNKSNIYSIPMEVSSSGMLKFGEASKLKSPINSNANDFGYCTDGKDIFFVSDRDDGKGGLDIYKVKN